MADYDHMGLVAELAEKGHWVGVNLNQAKPTPRFIIKPLDGYILSIKPTKAALKHVFEALPKYSKTVSIADLRVHISHLKMPTEQRDDILWKSATGTTSYLLSDAYITVKEYLMSASLN